MWKPGTVHQPLLHCESEPQSYSPLFLDLLLISRLLLCSSIAKLLRQGYHHRVPEKDCDLLEAAHRGQRRDHVRLQIPPGGEQDPLPVWDGELPWDTELVNTLVPHSATASQIPSRFTLLYIKTKPPSNSPSTPTDGQTSILSVTRKQKCTHLHFSRTLHSLGSFRSQCVRALCNLAFETKRGVLLQRSLLWQYCRTWLGYIFRSRCFMWPGLKGLSISMPSSVWRKRMKLKKRFLLLRHHTDWDRFSLFKSSPHPQPTDTGPHTDAQELQIQGF